MQDLKFKLAEKKDIKKIFEMFQDAIKEMDRNNIPQWDELYPAIEDIKEDVENKQLYVAFDKESVVATYVINQECDEEYINGKWEFDDKSFYVLHRICVNPKYQKCGVGTRTVKCFEEHVRSLGGESVRLDVFTLNPYSLKMYDKLNYKKVGMVYWRKGDFYLMEKKL
ncbi:MAG: GNAT family N-acetyltransferase [Clostridium sp.]|nr:GNAT family N-acetyltransferase [Clostridium sp.]